VYNNQDETDEINNVFAPFVINPNAPDLIVTSLTGPTSTVVAGTAFNLSWTVKNQGDVAASSASIADQVYYSTSATFDASAVALGNAYLRPNSGTPIASGASYTQTVAATLPSTLPLGVYYLYVKTDANNTQAEFNETNNVSAPFTVSSDKPDLVVTTFSGPTATVVPGDLFSLSWTVKNQGTVPAGASFIEDQVYYSTSSTFDTSAVALGNAYPRPNLNTPIAAGASYTQTVSAALPGSLAPGTYYLYVTALPSSLAAGTYHLSVVTLGTGAITLKNQADGSSVGLTTSVTTVNGQSVATVTFTGDGTVGGSLGDGLYTLTVDASQVTDAAGRHPTANYTASVFRLFGDANGDGVVDNADADAFRQTFGTKSADVGYLWYLDYDGNGTIDRATDAAQFTARNRKKV